jgi:hypothetical protein
MSTSEELAARRAGIERLWEYLELHFGYAHEPIIWSARRQWAAFSRGRVRFGECELETLWNTGFEEYANVRHVWSEHSCATRSTGAYAAWQIVLHEFAHRIVHERLGEATYRLPPHGVFYCAQLADTINACPCLAGLAIFGDSWGVSLTWEVFYPSHPLRRVTSRLYRNYSAARAEFVALCALGTVPRVAVLPITPT